MSKYFYIENNILNGKGLCRNLIDTVINVEVSDEVYNDDIEKYIWDGEDIILNPNWEEEQLQKAKNEKYQEASLKAFEYLESGDAVFEFEEGKHIEATDGNIAKLGLALVKFMLKQDYVSTIEWNTKENVNVQLNADKLQLIVDGLQRIQSEVWTNKFPAYNTQIAEAETVDEVNAINFDYTVNLYIL